jgi:ubiquinone biosynthesis protein
VIRGAIESVNRLRQIAAAVAKYGFASLFKAAPMPAEVSAALESGDAGAAAAASDGAAVRFRKLLEELGPTFIKFGQVLSTRPDFLPPRYIDELVKLRDSAPPLAFVDVRGEVERALGGKLAERFASFDETPLACASIAAVHRAQLQDGREVVVKVQRPGIDRVMRADLSLLYWFAAAAENVFAEASLYRPTEIVSEFESALLAEIDFRSEARNIADFTKSFGESPLVRAPRVIESHSTSTVLTLEFLDGTRISEIAPGSDDARALVAKFLDISFEQVFVHGTFHADPHPGNLMRLGDGRIGLLDFGLVGRLSSDQRATLIEMCLGIALRNADGLARLLYRVGRPDARVDLAAVRRDVAGLFDRFWGGTLGSIDPSALIRDLMELAQRHRVRMPKELALLAKAAATIEGVIRELTPNLDLTAAAKPYTARILKGELAPDKLRDRVTQELFGVGGTLRAAPAQIEQILADLSSGKFTVVAENAHVERLDSTLHRTGLLVASALLGGALAVACAIAGTALGSPAREIAWALGALGLAAGGGATVLSVLDRFRGKISVKRLLRK